MASVGIVVDYAFGVGDGANSIVSEVAWHTTGADQCWGHDWYSGDATGGYGMVTERQCYACWSMLVNQKEKQAVDSGRNVCECARVASMLVGRVLTHLWVIVGQAFCWF